MSADSIRSTESCVDGLNDLTDSSSSPKNSARAGSSSPGDHTSTIPPRIENSPSLDTACTRSYPLLTSVSAAAERRVLVPLASVMTAFGAVGAPHLSAAAVVTTMRAPWLGDASARAVFILVPAVEASSSDGGGSSSVSMPVERYSMSPAMRSVSGRPGAITRTVRAFPARARARKASAEPVGAGSEHETNPPPGFLPGGVKARANSFSAFAASDRRPRETSPISFAKQL